MSTWNKGKHVDQKKYLGSKRFGVLEIEYKREHLAIDSKLRSCDLISLRVRDISSV